MAYGFLPIGVLLGTAFLIPILSLKNDKFATYTAFTGCLAAMIITLSMVPQVVSEGRIVYHMESWKAPFGITVVIDNLSIVLSFLSILITFLVIIFSYRYVKERRTKYYSLLCLALVGALGMIVTGDIFNMFVYLEVMSVASYALIAFNKDRPALEASIKYLIMGSLATSLLLLGIAFLYGITGTLNMADISVKISSMTNPLVGISFGLILTGMLVKAGLIPFHAWLPDSYQASPSPVSSIFAGVTTNTGIYAILRVGFLVFNSHHALLWLMTFLGVISMVAGAFLALVQTNLKRLLGYSSISQMGYIAMSVGLGTSLGITGGILHICLLYTSPSPRDLSTSRMPSSA